MSGTVTADKIVGKVLYARRVTELRTLPRTSSPSQIVRSVPVGEAIGRVWSWVSPTAGELWWMFKNENGLSSYARHSQGQFDFESLREQGVMTEEEEFQKSLDDEKPILEKVLASTRSLIIAVVVLILIYFFVKAYAFRT